MQRQSVVDLLKMNVRQDFTLVLGWYLHEILASLEAASAILLDTEVRSLLLRHVMQAQSYFDSNTERTHLLETRALATFIATSLSHGLSSTSSSVLSPMMTVLTRQQQGILPFLLMHVDETSIFDCVESLLKNVDKPVELHLTIGKSICNEFLFQSPKVLNGNLIWKVEKLAILLCTFMETMGDNFNQLGAAVASIIEPLAHFLLKFTNSSYCSELVFLRLINLITAKFSTTPTLRSLIPQTVQSVSFSIPTLISSLKGELRIVSSELDTKRRAQIHIVILMEGLLKYVADYPQVLESMLAHSVVERVCRTAFFQSDSSSSLFHLSFSLLRSVLAAGYTTLITPVLINEFLSALNTAPKRFRHFTELAQEMRKVAKLAPLFSNQIEFEEPMKKKLPRQSLKHALSQTIAKEKIISKCLRQIFRSEDHPYGMVVSDFGRRIEKGFQVEEDIEKMLSDTRNTLDTFAKSVAETIKLEEGTINIPVFDLSNLCLEASYEVILSREPTVVLQYYHTKYIMKDRKLQSVIKTYGSKVTPADLHVPEKFLKKEEINNQVAPFAEAISIFKRLLIKKSPLEKIRKLKDTVTSICERAPSKAGLESGTPISADDLMAIFSYVIMKTDLKTLVSDSEFMGDFMGKTNLCGEPGYLVTTLQCCCMFLSSDEFVDMIKTGRGEKIEGKGLDKPA